MILGGGLQLNFNENP